MRNSSNSQVGLANWIENWSPRFVTPVASLSDSVLSTTVAQSSSSGASQRAGSGRNVICRVSGPAAAGVYPPAYSGGASRDRVEQITDELSDSTGHPRTN